MPKRTGGRRLSIELPPEEGQPASQAETQASEEADEVASELGAGSFAIITRLNRATAQYAYLDRIPGNEVNQAILAERYGGGSYKVQLRGPKAGKRNVILNTLTIEVDSSIPSKTPPGLAGNGVSRNFEMAKEDDGIPGMDDILKTGVLRLFNGYENLLSRRQEGEPQGGDSMIQLLIASMQSNSQMMMAMMQAQAQQQAVAAQAQASTMTALISAMVGNKPDIAEQLALIKAMTGDKQSFKDMLESFQMLREISGEVSTPEGWPGVVAQALPVIGGALQGAMNKDQSQQPPRQPTPPQLATGNPPPPQPAIPTEPDMLWKLIAKQQLAFLLKQAAADKEPELYAALLCDQIPDAYAGALRSVCESDTFITDTIAAFPETQPYADWFTKLLTEVRSIVLDEGDDNDELEDEIKSDAAGDSQESSQ